uniref:DUF3352 domain-containing protein n=1 Tax=Paulinella chromatophora TaxID=39717 RepID=B1X499_PAUCH|nr:hypothetical protein PCC_0327 [Paulinella chromatophora]ACB42768.1 hypothetical protein PCC_0327 [Paulinella chromatophora]
MKARVFLLAILATALILFSLGLGGWWIVLQSSPLRFQAKELYLPANANFIPRNGFMSFHLLTNPDWPSSYGRSITQVRERRHVGETIDGIRNNLFLLAGLDYPNELASWIGSETSFAILTPPEDKIVNNWLLVLSSRDVESTRRFLQRFWESRRVVGTNLKISNYRGMGLISGEVALSGKTHKKLATAWTDNGLLLIGSNLSVLEDALEVSQVEELSQAFDPNLLNSIKHLKKGVALFTAQPQAMSSLLSFPEFVTNEENSAGLVSALLPINHQLVINSLFHVVKPLNITPQATDHLLKDIGGNLQSLALINDSKRLMNLESEKNYSWILSLSSAFQLFKEPFIATILKANSAPLLWAQLNEGWLVGTSNYDPDPTAITNDLKEKELIETSLLINDIPTQVWTHLEAKDSKIGDNQLKVSLVAARQESVTNAWWGQNLSVFQELSKKKSPLLIKQLEALDNPEAPYRLAVTAQPAQKLLDQWNPWRQLQALSKQPLTPIVKGLSFSLSDEPNDSENNIQMRLKSYLFFR